MTSVFRLGITLLVAPFLAFVVYVACLVVPLVIREVVPEVLRTVIGG
jgi:hypothetical protein